MRTVLTLLEVLDLYDGYDSAQAALNPCHHPSESGNGRCHLLAGHEQWHRFCRTSLGSSMTVWHERSAAEANPAMKDVT